MGLQISLEVEQGQAKVRSQRNNWKMYWAKVMVRGHAEEEKTQESRYPTSQQTEHKPQWRYDLTV